MSALCMYTYTYATNVHWALPAEVAAHSILNVDSTHCIWCAYPVLETPIVCMWYPGEVTGVTRGNDEGRIRASERVSGQEEESVDL